MEKELVAVILRVKGKYIICTDKELKKYIGQIMAGDIKIGEV